MPAAPRVAQPGEVPKLIWDPSAAIDPVGHAGPVMGLWSSARVLSAYKMVIMSVFGLEVPSGLTTIGPRALPGSMAGRTTLHPALAELGPWNVTLNTAGGRLTGFPLLQPPTGVLGIEIPPVGIPVPV